MARRLEWDPSILLAHSIATILIVACGSLSIFLSEGPVLDLVGAGWRTGAAILLCSAGRTAMISWRRWSRVIPSPSSFLLHRLRRLAPVHLVSFSLVVAVVSAFSLMGMPDEASSTGVALNIIPLWPNAFAAQNNPSWFVLQALIIGSIAVPVVSMLRSVASKVLIIIVIVATGSVVPEGTIWSVTTFLTATFVIGALIEKQEGLRPMARAGFLIFSTILMTAGQALSEFPSLGTSGSMVTAMGAGLLIATIPAVGMIGSIRKLTRYAYPAIMLHYPLLRFGAVTGGPVNVTTSVLAFIILTYAAGRLLEKPHARQNLRRAMIQEAGHRAMGDEITGLPYHPEKGDNPGGPEKRSRGS
ncbi:hypothetical protein [uncultured Salinicola sp.]|uniref:hypothetical protein n=1 Tax=uncultured Salinicola sp. TaxID=1193542 RepID=UPI00260AA3D0|nr:hypothetical protein [uncultured Salinicola sp.]